MKILIISHEYPPIGGGGANACMNLSKEYAKVGHDVDIITVWYEGLLEKEVISDFKGNISIVRVKSKREHKEHCSFKEMLDFIVKVMPLADKKVSVSIAKNVPYDICQIFFGIPSGPIGYYLKKRYKLPYVIRFGGGDIPGFQERFTKVYKLIGPAIKVLWRDADALVANSEGLKKLAENFCDKYPILVYPNGVDTEYFYPSKEKKNLSKKIELLFVSRLIERKGLQFLIPRLKWVQEISDKKIHLTIVGDGPYRATLESLVSEGDLADMVSFEGQKDKKYLLGYYQKGDVFVFPSKKEGMPNAVLEAMACGLPIIMSPCQGSKELIEGNGIITDSDLTQFCESLCTLLAGTPEKLYYMAECSRQRAEELFSWQSVADKYMKLFQELVCSKR